MARMCRKPSLGATGGEEVEARRVGDWWATPLLVLDRPSRLRPLERLLLRDPDGVTSRPSTRTWHGSCRSRKCSKVSQPPPTRTIMCRPFRSCKNNTKRDFSRRHIMCFLQKVFKNPRFYQKPAFLAGF